jgi:hypothetical protein
MLVLLQAPVKVKHFVKIPFNSFSIYNLYTVEPLITDILIKEYLQ